MFEAEFVVCECGRHGNIVFVELTDTPPSPTIASKERGPKVVAMILEAGVISHETADKLVSQINASALPEAEGIEDMKWDLAESLGSHINGDVNTEGKVVFEVVRVIPSQHQAGPFGKTKIPDIPS